MESIIDSQSERVAVDEEGTLHFSYVLRNDTQTTRFYECAVSSPVLKVRKISLLCKHIFKHNPQKLLSFLYSLHVHT